MTAAPYVITIDATIGGTDSNSYVTAAQMETFAANQSWYSDWQVYTADQQAISLISATMWLDTLTFAGDRCSATQALKWPRKNASCDGVAASCDVIPRNVLVAQMELAWQLLQDPSALGGGSGGGAAAGTYVKRQKLGDLEVEYDQYNGSVITSCDNCNDPEVTTKFPWLSDLLSCWVAGLPGGVGLIARVRS